MVRPRRDGVQQPPTRLVVQARRVGIFPLAVGARTMRG
jgi:hypothetical protein